jgi:hypothetical protein
MIEKGTELAKKYNVKYKYVECYLDDMKEINFRLKNRDRMISQIKKVQSEEAFKYTIENSKKPSPSEYESLVVYTNQNSEQYIEDVMNYISRL